MIVRQMVVFCLSALLLSTAFAEKAPLSEQELKETATDIVVGKVLAIYSRIEREGNYEYTRYVAEVKIDKVEKGDSLKADKLAYVRYFNIKWVGVGPMPPGPGGHKRPKLNQVHRFFLARNAYDGFRRSNNDGGYNVVYGNGVQVPGEKVW